MTVLNACGPPVEMPSTTMSNSPRGFLGASHSRVSVLAGGLRIRALAAALTLAASSAPTSRRRSDARAVGFWMKSTAPASRALNTSSPASLATLRITMGRGRRAICSTTNASPSMFGIIRSHVTTSGFSASTCSSASRPSRAVPTTSTDGLRDNICVTTFRT